MSDLEEERRKLRLEVKFRAKYHGKAALEMGLSPEQLLLLEEYVEGLKGNRNPEERLVTQLHQRVRRACSLWAHGRFCVGLGGMLKVLGLSLPLHAPRHCLHRHVCLAATAGSAGAVQPS